MCPGHSCQPSRIYWDLLGFIWIYRPLPEVKLGQELFQELIPGASCCCGQGWSDFPASKEGNPGWSSLPVVPPEERGDQGGRDGGNRARKRHKSCSQIPQRGRASLGTAAGKDPGAPERVNPIQVSPLQAELIPAPTAASKRCRKSSVRCKVRTCSRGAAAVSPVRAGDASRAVGSSYGRGTAAGIGRSSRPAAFQLKKGAGL